MNEEQPSRYAISLEVLDELLPEREFLGPLFDDKITVLRAGIEAVSNEIRAQLATAVGKFPAVNQGSTLWPKYDQLRADIAEMSTLLQTLEQQLEAVDSIRRDGLAHAGFSPEDAAAFETVREAATTLRFQIGCFQGVEVRIGLTIFNIGFSNARTSAAISNAIALLPRLLAILQQDGGEVTKEMGLARAILKSLPAPGAEHAVEKYGKLLIGDAIAVLLPVTGILTDGFKRWREAKTKPEESIALVKLLIIIREVIHSWDCGDLKNALAARSDKDPDLNAMAVERYRSMVDDIHRQWLGQRPESLAAAEFSANS